MAKKTITSTPPPITELTVLKSEFKAAINDRINIGSELFGRKIQSHPELEKLKTDYSSWTDYNSEYLKQSFNNPYNEYKRSYEDAGHSFYSFIGGDENPVVEKKELIQAKIDNLTKLVSKADLLKASIALLVDTPKSVTPFTKEEVFIVHGHDEEATTKTARFIERIGFKPIILREQASSGKTIIEKIEECTNVGFGIVLYTPCDVGGKKTEPQELQNRARQNVVFEHGYLIGKIGRENVCALVKGDVETPNDISGVVYINMDSHDAWQMRVAKELKNSGYSVDMNKAI